LKLTSGHSNIPLHHGSQSASKPNSFTGSQAGIQIAALSPS
jgi:hypothetical protein